MAAGKSRAVKRKPGHIWWRHYWRRLDFSNLYVDQLMCAVVRRSIDSTRFIAHGIAPRSATPRMMRFTFTGAGAFVSEPAAEIVSGGSFWPGWIP